MIANQAVALTTRATLRLSSISRHLATTRRWRPARTSSLTSLMIFCLATLSSSSRKSSPAWYPRSGCLATTLTGSLQRIFARHPRMRNSTPLPCITRWIFVARKRAQSSSPSLCRQHHARQSDGTQLMPRSLGLTHPPLTLHQVAQTFQMSPLLSTPVPYCTGTDPPR